MINRPIRLGLMYSYREGWIGGSYYLLNLISALKRIRAENRLELTIFAFSEAELDQVRALAYPGARYRLLREPEPRPTLRLANRIAKKLAGRPISLPPAIEEPLDIIYPSGLHARNRKIPNHLVWIPDFQEEYLPEMFGQQQVANRRRYRGRIALEARHIVFSSQDAASDFRRFYPDSSATLHVLRFAVTHPEYQAVDVSTLREKFRLGAAPFFMVSNQFWKHKNHPLVVDALKSLLDASDDTDCLVCFSGKEHDGRNPEYAAQIRTMVEAQGLQDRIRFLGFIERAEQLALMRSSVAVIQPSLFEGWSTVIEDAKALGVPVLASDLPVHREQLGEFGIFFDPADQADLAARMRLALEGGHQAPLDPGTYARCIEAFGRHFVRILHRVMD
jgi:glycosyltransferase involved in cell wall biosynthesis